MRIYKLTELVKWDHLRPPCHLRTSLRKPRNGR